MRPIIRWAGSKRAIVDRLKAYWPRGARRYVEPFAGSACLFFELRPKQALIGDLNPELIGCYRALSRDSSLVLECLRRLPKGKKAYYNIRDRDPEALSDFEMAARFLYLNRNCFNGLYRTNASGMFNVPYGPPRTRDNEFQNRILDAGRALRGVTLLHADFEETLSHVTRGDFVYLDPPYVVESRRVFSEYLPGSFASYDLERLRRALVRLDAAGIPFLVSYADSSEARELLEAWQPRRIWTQRHIAGFAAARRGSFELLATNQRQYV